MHISSFFGIFSFIEIKSDRLLVFIFLIPGMIAYALNQKGLITLSGNDAAFSTMVKELLPIGFKGIVIGGILAALMSSLAFTI